MLHFVQIRNNRYENRVIFLLLANKNIVFSIIGSFVRKIKEKNTSAELSWCRNVSRRCRSVLVPNCPSAEVFSILLSIIWQLLNLLSVK